MFGHQKNNEQPPDLEVFTIFDTTANTYREPIFAMNTPDMIRSVDRFYRDPKNAGDTLFTHPECYQIFKIGSYRKHKAILNAHPAEFVANLHEIKAATLRELSQTGIAST